LIDFNEAIRINPKYVEAYTNRGNTYFRLKNRPAACEDWRMAKSLGSNQLDKFIEEFCN
jgi:tetratricopeptide (TPR) repeat protein